MSVQETIKSLFRGKVGTALLIILSVFLGTTVVFVIVLSLRSAFPTSTPPTTPVSSVGRLEKFASAEEFKTYLEEAEQSYQAGWGAALRRGVSGLGAEPTVALEAAPSAEKATPERVSETTVQVGGIDEPDIVKTDGTEIYFSSQYGSYLRPTTFGEQVLPPTDTLKTKAVKAFPPAELVVDGEIEKTGNLLLSASILVIFSDDTIYGYDVSDPASPEKKWDIELESNNQVVGARLYKGKIYLVTQTQVSSSAPCPIKPLSVGGVPLTISCTEIYHPQASVPVDVTYTAMTIDPTNGEVKDTVSFVGSSGSSVIYMSPQAIYATYSYFESFLDFYYEFFQEKASDIIPSVVISKIEKLKDYDISDVSKMTELGTILEQYQSSLSDDERLQVENELTNRMGDYYKENKRDLEKTGIVKIKLTGLEVQATGSVPGRPLNQFSLDEYEGNLRVAVTIGGTTFAAGGESANDVYVLDGNLQVLGSIKDMGLEERIYAVRFIEDKGYVVTFKQIDPFFVLDLSDPRGPELKGQLKIPGYSSYLHPITKDKILGIGKEESQVKISLFDVSDPATPTEADKYLMEESWSDILNTHHAFLLDKKHGVFFLPGSHGGYVFSYQSDTLKLEKAVSDIRARRAIYINDYMYIIGDDKLVVLNEADWTKVNQLEF